MDKFYRYVRRKLGINKETMKEELKQEVSEDLSDQFEEEISYIEAQMKEYEQFVAEVNHMMSTMRKDRIKKESESQTSDMREFEDDLQPLKSKLRDLEDSMQKRLDKQKAYTN